jgi:hypothetical protein
VKFRAREKLENARLLIILRGQSQTCSREHRDVSPESLSQTGGELKGRDKYSANCSHMAHVERKCIGDKHGDVCIRGFLIFNQFVDPLVAPVADPWRLACHGGAKSFAI